MKIKAILLGVVGVLAVAIRAQDAASSAERDFQALRDAYVVKFKPLWLESNAAYWEANTTGSDAAVERRKTVERALVDLQSDHARFAQVKALRDGGQVSDPVLRRELELMYLTFLGAQADPQLQKQIVDLSAEIEQMFNTFRPQVGDKTLTENDVREILANTTDSSAAEAAWKAYMEVGRQAEGKLRELVRLRNETARQVGFKDYYSMSIALQEIDEAELFRLFDELEVLTREPFAKLKAEIDARRAKRFGIAVADLRPWHFGDLFFQEAPDVEEIDLDDLFKKADLVELSKKYYGSIGLPVDDILARSDLYERPGKDPHGFCQDMDRAGDVRILINLKPNVYWADTIMHELGHGVYSKYVRPDVPFLLHDASHAITTEGIAELFGAKVKNGEWLTKVLGVEAAEAERASRAAHEYVRTEQLMFSRWAQVMARFEHGMYSDPDQPLGKLWWELKQRYQLLNPPWGSGPRGMNAAAPEGAQPRGMNAAAQEAAPVERPDYAAKVHILTVPVYYHSYMMGELFAAQVRGYIARELLHVRDPGASCYYGRPEVGAYLKEKIFGPGNLYRWDELTKRATGEPLTAKYFAAEFVK